MKISHIEGYPIVRDDQKITIHFKDNTKLEFVCMKCDKIWLCPEDRRFIGTPDDPRVALFNTLGISDRFSFVKNIVGYIPQGNNSKGSYCFPEVKSIEDLNKVLKALYFYNGNIKKHKAHSKLNFKL